MPLRDAARTACVSHAFLRSWRCHPNLTFSYETLDLNGNVCGEDEMANELTNKVDHIMRNHSGIGVRTFKLESYDSFNARYLNRWLQIVVMLGIEELTLVLPSRLKAKLYNFPCSLLFNGCGNSIMYLHLNDCVFHPTVGLGCLRRLHLSMVRITGDELGCLLSNSFDLEHLELINCQGINCLKTPNLLQRLSYLRVFGCRSLHVIEIEVPNLSTFHYDGDHLIQLSLGDALKVKKLEISCSVDSNVIHYARAKLPSFVPNIETLSLCCVASGSIHQLHLSDSSTSSTWRFFLRTSLGPFLLSMIIFL